MFIFVYSSFDPVEMVAQSQVLMQKTVSTTRQGQARGMGGVRQEPFNDKGNITSSQLLI